MLVFKYTGFIIFLLSINKYIKTSDNSDKNTSENLREFHQTYQIITQSEHAILSTLKNNIKNEFLYNLMKTIYINTPHTYNQQQDLISIRFVFNIIKRMEEEIIPIAFKLENYDNIRFLKKFEKNVKLYEQNGHELIYIVDLYFSSILYFFNAYKLTINHIDKVFLEENKLLGIKKNVKHLLKNNNFNGSREHHVNPNLNGYAFNQYLRNQLRTLRSISFDKLTFSQFKISSELSLTQDRQMYERYIAFYNIEKEVDKKEVFLKISLLYYFNFLVAEYYYERCSEILKKIDNLLILKHLLIRILRKMPEE